MELLPEVIQMELNLWRLEPRCRRLQIPQSELHCIGFLLSGVIFSILNIVTRDVPYYNLTIISSKFRAPLNPNSDPHWGRWHPGSILIN